MNQKLTVRIAKKFVCTNITDAAGKYRCFEVGEVAELDAHWAVEFIGQGLAELPGQHPMLRRAA